MDSYDTVIEELKDTTNPVEKNQLLQKYGLIPPKLTPDELLLIKAEETWGTTEGCIYARTV